MLVCLLLFLSHRYFNLLARLVWVAELSSLNLFVENLLFEVFILQVLLKQAGIKKSFVFLILDILHLLDCSVAFYLASLD